MSPKIKVKEVSSGWDHTILKTEDNQLYGLGSNKYKELGIEKEGVKYCIQPERIWMFCHGIKEEEISKFVCGFRQSYFLTHSNNLYGCG